MADKKMYLHSVSLEETEILYQRQRLSAIFSVNTSGPIRYLQTYEDFTHLVDGSMKAQVKGFIEESGDIKVRRCNE